ncbi:MAG: hypothetical protein GF331_22220 [Chitinivibrionales bacterium]|nr:hypothetical protein [Chitinivibrionales bacterium]
MRGSFGSTGAIDTVQLSIISRRFARVAALVLLTVASLARTQAQAAAQPAAATAPSESVHSSSDSSAGESGFRPGDALRITVAPDTGSFLAGVYRIDPHGRVLLPIVGHVSVASHDEQSLATHLNELYVEHLRYPGVQVERLVRASLLGGFARPGLYYLHPDATVWDAIRAAGGPLREDGLSKMEWKRGHAILAQDLVLAAESGATLSQIGFRSGDRFTVTTRPKRNVWDVFRGDVMPTLTFVLTSLLTAATLYQTYRLLDE